MIGEDRRIDRIVEALETIASRLDDPNRALITRVANLETLVGDFIDLVKAPRSTDQEWTDLLAEAEQVMAGSKAVVTV